MMILYAVALAVAFTAGDADLSTRQVAVQPHRVAKPAMVTVPAAPAGVAGLRQSLYHLDYPAMLNAVATIQPGEENAATAVLLEALKNEDPRIRWQAARAAGRLGAKAKDVVSGLTFALKDTDPLVRWAASESLAAAGAEAKPAVPTLIQGLTSKDLLYRRTSAEVLAKLGPHASDAIPSLFDALRDEDAIVRRWATQALREIFRTQAGNKIDLEDAFTDDQAGPYKRG